MKELLIHYPALIAAVIAIGFCIVRTAKGDKKVDKLTALVAIIIPAWVAAQALANLASIVRPVKYDRYIYQIDGLVGQPAFAVGRYVAQHYWLEIAASMAYSLLPIMIVVVFAVTLWQRPERELRPLMLTFVLNMAFALPLYLLIPVAGPVFQFPSFPQLPGPVSIHPELLNAAPNGVPSIHFSSALLIFWFSRRWRLGVILGGLFLVLTGIATLGSGQHYLFDLVVAVPYAITVCKLGKGDA